MDFMFTICYSVIEPWYFTTTKNTHSRALLSFYDFNLVQKRGSDSKKSLAKKAIAKKGAISKKGAVAKKGAKAKKER